MVENNVYRVNNKLAYVFLILNILCPILSVEGLLPWVLCIFFIKKSIFVINQGYKSTSKCFVFLVLNGSIIVIYNIIVYLITNYLSKMLL